MTILVKTTEFTKSKLFSVYNKFRVDDKLDTARVNRAFGILQRVFYNGEYELKNQDTLKQYHTTSKNCGCPDCKKRKKPCKHMIAVQMYDKICGNQVLARVRFWGLGYSPHATLTENNYDVCNTVYNPITEFEVDRGQGWSNPKLGSDLYDVRDWIFEKDLKLRYRMVKYKSRPKWHALYEVELVGRI